MELTDGSAYYGKFDKGQPTGRGAYVFTNGDVPPAAYGGYVDPRMCRWPAATPALPRTSGDRDKDEIWKDVHKFLLS